jgi:hypothetical protein
VALLPPLRDEENANANVVVVVVEEVVAAIMAAMMDAAAIVRFIASYRKKVAVQRSEFRERERERERSESKGWMEGCIRCIIR